MKRLLFVLALSTLLVGWAPEAAPELPPVGGSTYTVKLTPSKSTLTNEDSGSAIQVELASEEDETVKYKFEIGSPCYLKNLGSGLQEIIVKPNAYIKSVSNYTVKRLVVDFYGGKGTNFNVYGNGETSLEYHASSIPAADPNDGGMVYEYEVNHTSWQIKNETEFNKPGFYSISVIFEK